MEYNPNIFSSYEMPDATVDSNTEQTLDPKLLKKFGKFQRTNLQNGHTEKNSALAVFLVASVLETKNKQILNEAKGLDDVVTVISLSLSLMHIIFALIQHHFSDHGCFCRYWVVLLEIWMLRKHVKMH